MDDNFATSIAECCKLFFPQLPHLRVQPYKERQKVHKLLTCNRNDQCDTVHCNVTNPYVQFYLSVVNFTIMPCNLPPTVRISGNNTSGGVVLDRVLSQSHIFPLQVGVTLNISVSQLDNAIGFEVSNFTRYSDCTAMDMWVHCKYRLAFIAKFLSSWLQTGLVCSVCLLTF